MQLYNKLEVNDDEINVVVNQLLEKIRQNFFWIMCVFCLYFCYISFVVVKLQEKNPYIYLIIPFFILFLIIFKKYLKGYEHLLVNPIKFKVNHNEIVYLGEGENKVVQIPIKNIMAIEDKSVYLDYNDNRGWEHKFILHIAHGQCFIDTLDKKMQLIYKYKKDDDIVELEVWDLNLEHENYLQLVEYIKNNIER